MNGFQYGLSWRFKIGGGFLVGQSEKQTSFSGSSIAYVYPDKLTSILGHFENDTLVEACLHELSDIRFEHGSMSPTPIFRKIRDSATSKCKANNNFVYELANQTYLGKNALQRDAYEDKYLYIANSTIKGAGRGVFLKRNVTQGEVVGFYNGVRLTGIESKIKHEDRRSPYRMDNDWAVPEQILNIPPNYR